MPPTSTRPATPELNAPSAPSARSDPPRPTPPPESAAPPLHPLPAALATAGAAERLRILTTHKTIAMVGLSADPMRPSHFAAIYLLAEGYDVIPVNPRYAATGQTILGQRVYASLAEIPRPVGIVDVFRKPQDVPPIAEEAIRIGAPVLWLQLGVVNGEAAALARAAGLAVVMDRCIKIEHARFCGGLNLVGMNTGVITARRGLT